MENSASRTAQTRVRLIKAVTKVFATADLTGDTTREIARVAALCFLPELRYWVCTY